MKFKKRGSLYAVYDSSHLTTAARISPRSAADMLRWIPRGILPWGSSMETALCVRIFLECHSLFVVEELELESHSRRLASVFYAPIPHCPLPSGAYSLFCMLILQFARHLLLVSIPGFCGKAGCAATAHRQTVYGKWFTAASRVAVLPFRAVLSHLPQQEFAVEDFFVH